MSNDPTSTTQGAAALTAARATAASPGPAVATSQVLTVPALDGPERFDVGGSIQALRKADDRRTAERRREGQRQDATDAQQAVRGATTSGDFARPVAGRVTSNYGSRGGGTHYGLDVANRIGTPIRAAAAGTVISAGPASGFGMWVRVRHDDGTITVYGHINKAFVDVGQDVGAGDLIAEVGNRGRSTGPHLHFEAHSAEGKKLDPGRWLDQRDVGF
ncbi:M23 family metallopeptidase [Actinomycetospora sp. CA-101289]|uniref:M23 family metallopeptidase n=1 Tax=Actinomycetospora sp. CA-101289 TaxID=3239893 RepID=UPI003D99D227